MDTKKSKEIETEILVFLKKHPAITISIVAILATLSLYAYFLGVLDRFQLDPSLFPLSIEQAYQLGTAFLVRDHWLNLIGLTLFMVIIFTIFCVFAFYCLLTWINKIGHLLTKLFPNLSTKYSPIALRETTAFSFSILIGIIILLGMFYRLGGYKSVNRNIVDYSSTIKMKGENGALYKDVALILCSEFCAVHVNDSTQSKEKPTIILLPVSDIEYIKQKLTRTKE